MTEVNELTEERNQRKIRIGVVSSDVRDKTVAVDVERLVRHPLFGRVIRKRARLVAHDENNEARIGDKVEVMETRPLSKTKRWRLTRIIEKAK
jgi:small subunit ribosomal protein S17